MSEGEDEPGFLKMIRAPFLFAILVPLVSVTLVSTSISGSFNLFGFVFASITGFSLHITTNVYNDIYDTKQGADDQESKENEFSGGSGVIVDDRDLLPKMYMIARTGIVVGVTATFFLMFFIDRALWLPLWIVIAISVFLSKYYTAEPFKLAYRGLGEVVVVLGFGPLAVFLASFGQNMGFHPIILSISPITGLSTLFIVWMGEMVDLPTDLKGGKIGLVARLGFERAKFGMIAVHMIALLNVFFVIFLFLNPGWPLLIAFLPHIFLLPKLIASLKKMDGYGEKIDELSKLNFTLYISFSLFLMAGYGLDLILQAYL